MAYQREYWERERERERRSPEHPVIAAFVTPKINYISNYIDLSKINILDVGCGNGFFTHYFSKHTYSVGLDYSRYMLTLNPCNPLIQGSALSIPFKANSFELVFSSNLLHHVEDPVTVVRSMKRVSRKFVVLLEPNRNNPLMALFSATVLEEHGALKFSLRYMKRLIEHCGLKTVASCSMGSIVPNKTPLSLLKWFKRIDWEVPFGFYNIIIARK